MRDQQQHRDDREGHFSIFTTPAGEWRVRREQDGKLLAVRTESGYEGAAGLMHFTYLERNFPSLSEAAWALHRAAPGENLDEFNEPPWRGGDVEWVDEPGPGGM